MSGKEKIFAVLLAILVIFWTFVIFAQSAKNGQESTDDTESVMKIIEKVVGFVFPGLTVSSHLIRKLAHFGEYLVLGLLTAGLAARLRGKLLHLAAWGYAVVVACFDEFLVQRLSEGRSPQWTDVLIDSAGALCGCIGIVFVVYLVRRRKEGKRKSA